MKNTVLGLSLTAALFAGCSWLTPYRIDVNQGVPLTAEQAQSIQVGMTQQQVRYLLGTPTVFDAQNAKQWIYLYTFKPGTYGEKYRIKEAKSQKMVIWFDDNGVVKQVDGAENFPKVQPTLPSYQEITGKSYY